MKKNFMSKKFVSTVLSLSMLTLFVACGSDDDDNSSATNPPTQEEQNPEGTYRVVLTPVNPTIIPNATGTGEIIIEGDEFRVKMNVDNALAAEHMQHVHIGSACPAASSDTNNDGVVDVVEAGQITGGALIPFDNEIRTQMEGGNYPSGASYDYEESGSFSIMLTDLQLPDMDANDMFAKLGAGDDLNLEGRVVEVHGVPSSTTLPSTAQGAYGMSAHATLPILCGVIERADLQTTGGTTDSQF